MQNIKKYFIILYFLTTSLYAQTNTELCTSVVDTLTGKTIYHVVDKMPEPEGGMENLISTLMDNLEYHTQATVSGKIYVGFIVDMDGKIIGERILRDPMGGDFAEQILSMIKKASWIPGSCNEVKVPVFFRLPIIIDLK